MRTLVELLAEHPFLEEMSQPARQIMVGCARNTRADPGDYIARQGDAADHIYLIRHGLVRVQTRIPGHDPIVVETLGDGDILGWSCLVPPYCWRFDVRASQVTRLISLDAICLRRKCHHDHRLGYQIYQRVLPAMAHTIDGQRHTILALSGVAPTAVPAP